jgi:hyaluronoglucosaminidase
LLCLGALTAASGAACSSALAKAPTLVPAPQAATYAGAPSAITAEVVVHRTARSDPEATAEVVQLFRAAGARVRLTRREANVPRLLDVYVGRTPAVERSLRVATAATLAGGGYVLVARNGTIVLDGADRAGQFYAAQTLRQLVAASARIPGAVIRDWPTARTRGLVEGFYGAPWSEAERADALRWLGRHRLNHYVVMPKDDPYVRAQWRTPFPAATVAAYARLVHTADRFHVILGFGLSPGDSICYSSPTDESALAAKLQALWGIGARRFTIGFDDIDTSRTPCPEDVAAFGTGSSWLGSAQAAFVTRLAADLDALHLRGARLTVVPTEYSGAAQSDYVAALAAGLPADVVVEWTGPFGVSPSIGATAAAASRARFAHHLVVWDNFYVNDYLPGSLVLGAYTGRDASLAEQVDGILLDPMNEPELMKLGAGTAASYLWNPSRYDPRAAWDADAREAIGGDAAALAALRTLALVNAAPPVPGAVVAPELDAAFRAFWLQWNKGETTAAAAALRPRLVALRDAPGILRSRLPGNALVGELGPWLDQTEWAAGAAVAALDSLLELRQGQAAKEASDAATARKLREQALLEVLPGTTTSIGVAGGSLLSFVHYALRGYGP